MSQPPDFGPRPGETQAPLPAAFDAGVYFIGRCRTPWTRRDQCPKNVGLSDAPCTLEIDAGFAPGLARIEERDWIWALYWMHHSPRDVIVQKPRHSADPDPKGVFALRSPARPNPIALSALRLYGVERRADGSAALRVGGLDCLDGTPLIDVKPVSPADGRPFATDSAKDSR